MGLRSALLDFKRLFDKGQRTKDKKPATSHEPEPISTLRHAFKPQGRRKSALRSCHPAARRFTIWGNNHQWAGRTSIQ